jgi:hypothetical protein
LTVFKFQHKGMIWVHLNGDYIKQHLHTTVPFYCNGAIRNGSSPA